MLESPDRVRLLELMSRLSYEEREVTLVSGKKSNFYVDCKQSSLHPEGQVLIGRLGLLAIDAVERREGRRFSAVGGLTLGADAIWPRRRLVPFAGVLRIRYLPPVSTDHWELDDLDGHIAKIRADMLAVLDEG